MDFSGKLVHSSHPVWQNKRRYVRCSAPFSLALQTARSTVLGVLTAQEKPMIRVMGAKAFCKAASYVVLVVSLSFVSGCFPRGGGDGLRLGREVITDPLAWSCVSNRAAVVFARDVDTLRIASKKATFAQKKISQFLPLPEGMPLPVIYIVDDSSVWKQLSTQHQLKVEGISLVAGREILVLQQNKKDLFREAVPHELMHYMLQQIYSNLPLFMEEGMALHYGWEINLASHLDQGDVVQRRMHPVSADFLLPIDDLMLIEAYPESGPPLETFYRQSERFAKAVDTLIGTQQMSEFVSQVVTSGKGWRDILLTTYTCTPRQIEWVEQAVESRKR